MPNATADPLEQLGQFVSTMNDSMDVMTQHDYHMYDFYPDSLRADAIIKMSSTPKIPTIKERVGALLNDPSRKLKKDLKRKEIFIIVYNICVNLNCREGLTKSHIGNHSRRLIRHMWECILPKSLTNYIHDSDVIVKFTPKATTGVAKMAVIKTYFDNHVEEICKCILDAFDHLRLIYSMAFPEVYYQSDEGLKIYNEVRKDIEQQDNLQHQVLNSTLMIPSTTASLVDDRTLGNAASEAQQDFIAKTERRMRRCTPYDVIKRSKK